MENSKRFPGPPARVVVPNGRGPALITGSRPSFASALTDCWNSTTTPSSSRPSTSSSSASAQNELKTSCLFCPNFVTLSGPRSEPYEVISKRNKLLKNLCSYLKVDGRQLPPNGTKAQLPFCNTCNNFISELNDLHETLEKIKARIETTVTTIERIVADREILGTKAPPSAIERQKFVKLYDMILEGYRNKLMLRQQRNNSMSMGASEITPQKKQKLRQFTRDLSPTPASQNNNYLSGFGGIAADEDENMEVSVDPLDVGAEIEVGIEDSPDLQHQSYEDYNFDEEEAFEPEWDDGVNTTYNENNCTLVISNVQSTAGGGGGGSGAAEVIDLVDIKQEVMAAADEEEDEEEEDDGDGTSASVYAVDERKRRCLFEGVEILKVKGTGSRKLEEFLQCSICDFTLPLMKLTRREAKAETSPYMQLKQHIHNVHNNQPGLIKQRAAPQFTCGVCNITFPNLQGLREHNKTHPTEKIPLPCDICGRSIKGGSFNLSLHKFSHKNDVERMAAIAANERGSYNAFLSAKLESVYSRKKNKANGSSNSKPKPRRNNTLASQRNRNKKKRNIRTRKVLAMRGASAAVEAASVNNNAAAPVLGGNSSNQSATGGSVVTPNSVATRSARAARRRQNSGSEEVGVATPYGCRICNKHFSQKNHLTLHVRSHGVRRSERSLAQQEEEGGEPTPSTSAAALASSPPDNQSIGAGIASRRRGALATSSSSSTSAAAAAAVPPTPSTSSAEGEGLPPPLLSPVETAALAENLESV